MIDEKQVKQCKADLLKIKKEVAKVVVGQTRIINGLLRSIISNGHVLVEGIPGIAKTLAIKALATASGCKFNRIQFTVDLLPSDIVGVTGYEKERGFFIVRGPIFTNFLLADEINRAPPKAQSALLESMQEKQATVGKETIPTPLPFLVMATINPIETSGTYALPEAQVDRFLFKLEMSYPKKEEEKLIIERNISLKKFEDYKIAPILNPQKLIDMQNIAKEIGHTDKIKDYIVDIVEATRHPKKYNIKLGDYVEWGSSPRACIGLFIAAKADALMKGDTFITPQHIKDVAHEVMRHRVILNYKGQAEGVKSDDIITEILSKIKVP
ncbi:MAG: MoxR family ATPase [Candidatus Woesearchaeota archaeon]|mgnify:CR=1 FL=1|jgi:MoxR-like ATPase|nr:MoxR family ATPase [Candidatus Woesearchaeota archaeon]MDP7506245.1 MoxR family ATPase [Candidatus Woesearchaeota archaeon]MDP7610684.1 MoxR family ATPase [Candidatus Woesearchaeota archaeon]|tara:strand:- start:2032 stop:3009 length:978 start_codon:yes stop_codon:yes gene_type:complete